MHALEDQIIATPGHLVSHDFDGAARRAAPNMEGIDMLEELDGGLPRTTPPQPAETRGCGAPEQAQAFYWGTDLEQQFDRADPLILDDTDCIPVPPADPWGQSVITVVFPSPP
jgi:hypothetical protein